MPSTLPPVAADDWPASVGAAGMGTPSKPDWPAFGAGFSGPSVLSGPSLSFGVLVCDAGLPPPLATASAMPTAAAMTRTAAPIPMNRRRCRSCRASRARISATFALATSRFLLALDTCSVPPLPGQAAVQPPAVPAAPAIRAYWTPRARDPGPDTCPETSGHWADDDLTGRWPPAPGRSAPQQGQSRRRAVAVPPP